MITYSYFSSISFDGGYKKDQAFIQSNNFWKVFFLAIYHSLRLYFKNLKSEIARKIRILLKKDEDW